MRCIPLVKHFLRVMFYYKVNFIFTLGVPIVSIIWSMRGQIFSSPDDVSAMAVAIAWTAYMIVLYALMSSGPTIVLLREEQFLKMFTFISGSKWLIVAGKFFAQLIVLAASVLILDLLCSLLFALPFFTLFSITLLMILICEVPVCGLFLFFVTLKIRPETVMPITNILIFAFIALTLSDFSGFGIIGDFAVLINPIEYAAQVGFWLLGGSGPTAPLPIVAGATIIYVLISIFSLKHMKLLPIFRN